MSPPDGPPAGFDALLHDTLAAPRLSASKVAQLSRLALHHVAHDHHIVTTLYKLNAALPPASHSRISSLYVFDAIARAAQSAASKGVGKELTNERGKGTQASLLRKLEGVVASWVDGMIDDGKGGVWIEGRVRSFRAVTLDISCCVLTSARCRLFVIRRRRGRLLTSGKKALLFLNRVWMSSR